MKLFYSTKRLNIRYASKDDINWIMQTERNEENKNFIFQGTFEDHLHEIESDDLFLSIIETKDNNQKIGFFISKYDKISNIFEFRRFAINPKNKGYGTETIIGLMKHVFNNLSINRFWLDVFTYNKPGIHIYESLGMLREGTIREGYKSNGIYKDYYIYSILKKEYKKRV
ncbi:MAG: GNAT family protein [Bacillota bacterium]|nr:GNAT family protein [Bacillota bacterium]